MKYLENTLKEFQLPCNDLILRQFETYRKRILEYNEVVNLTAIKEEEDFELRHFVDSLMICQREEMREVKKVIDVGTGAGFPGIPLAIVYPDKQFTLMDSLGKRMKIVKEIAEEIGLKNVEVIHARAEELGHKKEYRESYDLCVSRAVANLAVLSEYCLPFVKTDGWFAPYKTAHAKEEIDQAQKAISLLGGQLEFQTSFCSLGCSSGIVDEKKEELEHCILWIKKREKTKAKYPRRAGIPSKEPLK